VEAGNEKEKPRIRVDEDWKKSVAEEKERLREREEPAGASQRQRSSRRDLPRPSMQVLVAGLYTQTLVALGAVENPVTGKKATDIDEAAYLIDTIAMLKEKTEGNLTAEEGAYVQGVLTDLRLRYVRAAEHPAEQGSEPSAEG